MSIEFDDAELAKRLRDVLILRRRSQRDVSRELNIPYRTLQNYLSGDVKIPAVVMMRICHLLGVESDYLIYQDFKLPRPDVHDAIVRALDNTGLIPPTPPSGAPTSDEERRLWDDRQRAISEVMASFRTAYEQSRIESVKTELGTNDGIPFGQRRSRD